MKNQNFTTTFLVDQTPEEAFAAVTNPRGWWSEEIEGKSDELGAVFYYHYQDVHRAIFKITELVPGKKAVWHVLDNDFNFIKDKTEWNGTDVVFEIAKKGEKTEVRFTHVGLVPNYECYDVCSNAWGNYVAGSLRSLIATGKGQPNPRVGEAPAHQKVAVAKVREMTKKITNAAVLFLVLAFGFDPAWAQKSQHATVVDPDVHHVVFENEYVRVIDARAAQGWKSEMHSHDPMLVIVLESGRLKVTFPDGKTQIVDFNPGTVVWQEKGFEHAWELLAGEVRVLLIEVKSANTAAKRSP